MNQLKVGSVAKTKYNYIYWPAKYCCTYYIISDKYLKYLGYYLKTNGYIPNEKYKHDYVIV